jgi:hypothetical protein
LTRRLHEKSPAEFLEKKKKKYESPSIVTDDEMKSSTRTRADESGEIIPRNEIKNSK